MDVTLQAAAAMLEPEIESVEDWAVNVYAADGTFIVAAAGITEPRPGIYVARITLPDAVVGTTVYVKWYSAANAYTKTRGYTVLGPENTPDLDAEA